MTVDTDEVEVSFMVRASTYKYKWPSRPDTSWESVAELFVLDSPELDEKMSTNRNPVVQFSKQCIDRAKKALAVV